VALKSLEGVKKGEGSGSRAGLEVVAGRAHPESGQGAARARRRGDIAASSRPASLGRRRRRALSGGQGAVIDWWCSLG
jgi:hypothetical protein